MEVIFQFFILIICFCMALEDDFARQKSAAEYIYRQLCEADEANLLNEEGCLDLFFSSVDSLHWILIDCSILFNSGI